MRGALGFYSMQILLRGASRCQGVGFSGGGAFWSQFFRDVDDSALGFEA